MKIKKILAGILSVTLLFGAIPADHAIAAKKISMRKTLSLTTGKTKTLKVKNTKKKVKWKIVSGKKYISIKKKGKQAVTVKGRKKGTAKIRATVGKKKLTCKVTVKNAKKPQKTNNDNTPVQTAAAPGSSVVPGSSAAPNSSAAPDNPTGTPGVDQPGASAEPNNSAAPDSSSEPTSSAAPGSSSEPNYSAEPNNSAAPDSSSEPTSSATPDNSAEPDNSATPDTECNPTNAPAGADKNDVKALEELIRTQQGAGISEDMSNQDNYTWEDGRLTGLDFSNSNLSGQLDLSPFTALTYLDCEKNDLTTLDVSKNTALKRLHCSENSLTVLDVSKNTDLIDLMCWSNDLTVLDVSNNTALDFLICWGNNLTVLDVSKNTALTELSCDDNVTVIGYTDTSEKNADDEAALKELIRTQRAGGATVNEDINSKFQYKWENGRLVEIDWEYQGLSGKLDVTPFSALESLNCFGNELTSLDVSKNVNLTGLYCDENQLTSLDVSGCVDLDELTCTKNQLTSLDVSGCVNLIGLYCDENQLTSLDLSNNTSLAEVSYDNDVTIIGYSDTSEKNADDVAALQELIRTQRAGGATVNEDINSKLQYGWENGRLVRIDWEYQGLSGKLDVTPFSALKSLNCWGNQLSSLDVSHNTALKSLNCWGNQLSSLDVSHNTALEELSCGSNQLTSLDLTYNTKLEALECDLQHVTIIGYGN